MILITGDTHGYIDFNKLKTLPMKIKDLTYNDYVIIAGDFGGVWSEKTLEQDLYHYKKLPFTVLFVDGNHENFELLNIVIMRGNQITIFPNFLGLMIASASRQE